MAAALATRVAIFGRRSHDAPPARIPASLIARGYFRSGAHRFVVEPDEKIFSDLHALKAEVDALTRELEARGFERAFPAIFRRIGFLLPQRSAAPAS